MLFPASRRLALSPKWTRDILWRRARAVPSLDLRFANNKSLVDATTGQNLVSFTRASSGTYVDSQGVIRTATTNEARFDHNPTTGESLGLLVEEQRTNSIRNNTMVGAVAGTPGTLPTNWGESLTGLSRQVVKVGTENGIDYIDLRFFGTIAGTQFISRWDGITVPVANGQTWTLSAWISLISGTLPSGNVVLSANLYNSGSSYIGDTTPGQIKTLIGATLSRLSGTATINAATAAFARPYIYFLTANGEAVDFTLRIGMPQFEQGAFVTSVIPTSGTTATRSADVASITGSNFSSWYNQSQGTLYAVARSDVPSASLGSVQPHVSSIDDGTTSNRISFFYNTGPAVDHRIVSAGVSTNPAGIAVSSPSGSNYHAIAYGVGTSAGGAVLNGSAVAVSSPAAIPVVNQLSIAKRGDTTLNMLNGRIARLTFWPQRLPNSTLQQITQ